MGYPMTWQRLVHRNGLTGDYTDAHETRNIAGDMRRLESDTRDREHLICYSVKSGATEEQVRIILDMFFDGSGPYASLNIEEGREAQRRIEAVGTGS